MVQYLCIGALKKSKKYLTLSFLHYEELYIKFLDRITCTSYLRQQNFNFQGGIDYLALIRFWSFYLQIFVYLHLVFSGVFLPCHLLTTFLNFCITILHTFLLYLFGKNTVLVTNQSKVGPVS